MQQVTIGTKNQIVIPKEMRKKIKGMVPGNKVSVYQLDSQTIAMKVDQQSWTERSLGAMTEAWKDIDPIAELKKIRDEWER